MYQGFFKLHHRPSASYIGEVPMAESREVTTTPSLELLDPFYRPIMVEPYTVFDSKQLNDNLPLFFDDQEVSGAGTSSVHTPALASTRLSVTDATAGKRVRQTFQSFNYQPGKGQQGIFTFTMSGNADGCVKEVGMMDDDNGVFFRMNGANPEFVIRSSTSGSPVDNVITRNNWNKDKMDGIFPTDSDIDLDLAQDQILFIGFEWLGVGSVTFGFFFDGKPIIAHQEHHANKINTVYMSTPNLPIRYSIENTGSGPAGWVDHICSTIISYGGVQPGGVIRSVDRGITEFSTGNNTGLYPVISIRKKTSYESAVIDLKNYTAMDSSVGTAIYKYAIILNPTIVGVDNASWQSVPNSAIEYDISRDNAGTISGGTVVISGYIAGNRASVSEKLSSPLRLGTAIDGTRDEFCLCMQNVVAANNDFFGSLSWRELL